MTDANANQGGILAPLSCKVFIEPLSGNEKTAISGGVIHSA